MSETIKKNSICAVVVTYNRKELLCECIEALLAQTFKEFDILVVDNHSTDGTYDALNKYLGRIVYEDTGYNLGGAGGFQYGLRKVESKGYEYAWIMDDDCIVQKDALEQLVSFTNVQHNFGFLSSKVLWTDGSLCNMNIQRRKLTKKVTEFDNSQIEVCMSTFVSLFIPIKVVRKVGLPIKEFVIWSDDLEYTRRISKEYSCYLIPTSVVLHKTKNNSGANIALDSEERIERYRYAYRNEMYLYKREGLKGIIHIFIRTPLHLLRVLIYSKSKKCHRMRTILGGTFDGFKFCPVIEYIE